MTNKNEQKRKNKIRKKYRVVETKEDSFGAYKQSQRNLKDIDKPRKVLHPTFTAEFGGTECARCFSKIEKGDCVLYNEDDELVHARHKAKEVVYEICGTCFLTKPCECEEE